MEQLYGGLRRLARSPAFKFVLICFLVLILLIPLALVFALVMEREGRAREVQREVARTWGAHQQVTGPFLIVPYVVRLETVQGDKRVEQMQERRAVFLPEKLDIKSNVSTKVLRRSIYEVVVYTTQVALEGRFLAPVMADAASDAVEVRWADAVFALGISDVSGLKDAASLTVNAQGVLPFSPSIGVPAVQQNGIHVKLAGAGEQILPANGALQPFSFRLELTFGGSSALDFAPVARDTSAAMTSDWPHPSFSGSFLPVERSVRSDGFSATWRVPHRPGACRRPGA
jgi:inner membrane protein